MTKLKCQKHTMFSKLVAMLFTTRIYSNSVHHIPKCLELLY